MNNNDLIKNLKLGFMGTPSFAAPILERLIADNYYIDYVYTQSGRPAGRGMKVRNSIIYEVAKKNRSSIIEINGKLESEMADFSEEEKKLILDDYGIKESGLDLLIREAYDTLGLNTFFTCGEKEVRAWTMKKGAQAVEAAGEIHSDFATKFIKAEIYTYQDAINNREKINELKTMGLVKMVGRDYIMQEGDIAYFIKGQ